MGNAPAAGHALDVLTLLATHPGPMPAGAIGRALGLPRSSTYHLLTVLCERGYVAHLPQERRYGLGPAAWELGSAYQRQAPLQRYARPMLARLAERTGRNAHFAVLHGRDVLYVIEERAPGGPRLVTDVGVRLPAHLTASGLAVLSALPAQQIRALFPGRDALVDRDGRGWPTVSALRRELMATRARGYALEVDLVTAGFSSVGCAVLDHTGHPVAGVAVTYPSAEVGAADEARLADSVARTTTTLSNLLAGRS